MKSTVAEVKHALARLNCRSEMAEEEHLWIDEEKDILQTKGINGDAAADAVISRDQVVGRVVKIIPVLGFFVMMIQSIYFWIILITGIIIYFVIKALLKEIKKGKLQPKK